MRRRMMLGALAGAAGTLALDVTTYLDMAVRGRSASGLPAEAAGRIANRAGIPLGAGDRADNRKSALGALLGYGTGVGLGMGYALTVGYRRRRSVLLSGATLGALAMAAADTPMVVEGLTDPRQWGTVGWVSDLIPHLVYGVVTTTAFDAVHVP